MAAFIHGFILAFGLIIPLGIQNIFIFNQGVMQPKLYLALPSVLTAFVCDSILIILAVLGVSLIILQVAWLKIAFFVFGFFFLMYMGFVTWESKVDANPAAEVQKAFSIQHQIYFAASVSLLNPHALLDIIGVIGTNSLNYEGYHKLLFCLACMLVSLLWFLGLALAGSFVQKSDQKTLWLNYVNKISALVIWGVGFYIFWQIILILQKI